ncbi:MULTISPECIES: ESPR-type extended signal peptide-containing protein [Pasteurellaceae]|uniref:ESPR-type extended signal peptide-containing protein n=1 Tax=Pasteurella atlantica TaxID=2827233 RepID=A0AAW8CR33_9PAST|nr:ESPR-type extended signal peptide-containing protein [Pasteurella atlantica]MBR0573928.1 hypothetical protein [Pasteurella atlantica]MDP8039928.1 ESPR-type extended signal peptide-containing protein [Pasteurella atlantica]MDP8042048.1 ESPR-type extended signal peptide-containing protein [Pasteurella atlantica]MDP8044189.1 ESPR-type extended signal peptide-containing protein [Pasteurella atlantica]MDP8046247.1 ESPR-type extended signal peptide-containing protein [Pasteurella atlantica]
MNKVYKVIWCNATQTFVAVSELSKAKGKSSTTTVGSVGRSILPNFKLATLSLALLTLFSGQVMAGTVAVGTNTEKTGVKWAEQGRAQAGHSAVAVGDLSNAAQQSIAVGNCANAAGGQSVAIGGTDDKNGNCPNRTQAIGGQSIAIGGNVIAQGRSSVAIGGDDTVTVGGERVTYEIYDKNGTSIGQASKTVKDVFEDATGVSGVIGNRAYPTTKTGAGAVAVGVSSEALGTLSTAFGVGTKIEEDAHLGLALGAGAHVSKMNAVAIGSGAQTDVEARKYKEAIVAVLDSKGKPTGKEIHYKGFSGGAENLQPGDYVSFGQEGYERQLKNVAAGKVDRDSTDAVNGSQLVSLGQALTEEINNIETYFHVNESKGSQKEGDAVTNLGGIRDKAGAKGNYSITGGVEAVASEKFGISLGYKSSVLKRNGVALGSNSSATEEYGVSIGSYAETSNVGAVALGPSANASVERGVALGANSNADREGFASGVTVETADNATFGGNKVYAMRSALAGDKTGVVNTVSTNDTGAVSVGSADRKRQIINLAAGSEDGDAVNVAQLKAVANTTEGYFHTNDGTTTQATGDANTNLGFINEKAGATGTHSVTAGVDAKATGDYGSMALGYQASSSEDGAVAIGQESKSKGASSVAIGYDTSAANIGAMALGRKAVSENSGIAMGNESHSQGLSGIAVGYQSVAIGDNSVAVGKLTNVVGGGSTAVGFQAKTSDRLSTALGQMAWAEGLESLAVGSFTKAAGAQSIAIGNDVHADGERTIVIGSRERGTDSYDAVNDSASSGNMAIAIGSGNTLNSNDKLAEADGNYSIALGTSAKTETTAVEGIAIGRGANVTGEKSIAIGSGNTVSGNNSGAFGDPSIISGDNSYSFGNNNTIANTNTFVLGNEVTTVTNNSVVLGNLSKDEVAVAVIEGIINGVTYGNFAGIGAPENGVVSVGDVGKERQIVNVAAGEISATSTDAINGSQLHAVAKKSAWTLQKEGEDVDKVAGDIVNFAKGNGVVVNITKEEGKAGKPDVNTITFDIDQTELPQTKVAEGKNIEVTPEFDGQAGNTIYTVDGHKTTITRGDMIDVEYFPSNNGFDHDYKISLNEDTQKKINALSKKVFGLNADNQAEQSIKLGDTINIRAGNADDTSTKNLKTEVNGSTVTISMKNKPVFEEVTANKVTINNATTSGKDAINKKYLDDQLGNTFKLTDQSGDSTATQTLNKEGGLDFKLVGGEGIETKAVAGSNQVKIKLDTETKAKIDKVNTIETDVTTLKERKISLGGDTNSETNEQKLSKDIKFDIVGSTNSAIQTNALDDKVELKVLVDDKTIEIAKNKLQAKTTDFDPSTDGTVAADNEDALATAGDIATAINNSGFIAKATKSEGKVDGSRKHKVATGTTLQFDAGKNIKIKQEDGKFTFSTVDAPEFENATVKNVDLSDNDAVVNVKELKAAKKDLTDVVDNLGNNTIQLAGVVDNLGNNTIQLAGNDGETKTNLLNQQGGIKFGIEGENGGEIVTEAKNTNKVVLKLNQATKDKLAKLDENKNLSDKADNDLSNITNDGKKNITKLGTIVEAADNSVDVSAPEVDSITGQKTYKVKVATTTLLTGPTGKVITPIGAEATKIATAGDVANAINKASHKVKVSNSKLQVTEQDGVTTIATGETLEIEAGKNLVLKADAGKKLQLSTAREVEFDKTTVGNVVTDSATNKITGLGAGTDDKDAINFKQLKDNAKSIANILGGGSTVNPNGSIIAPTLEVVDPVTGNNTAPTTVAEAVKDLSDAVNNPLYVKADVLSGTAKEQSSAQKLGSTLQILTGKTSNGTSGDNLETKVVDGIVTISMKDKSLFEEIQAGKKDSPITIGTKNGKNVISGLDSTLPTGDTNATVPILTNVQKGQAATLGDIINAGWNLQVEGANADFVKPYDTVNFVAKENSGITVNEKADSTGTKTNIEIGLERGEIVSSPNAQGTNGFVTGVQVAEAINNSGFKLKAQKGDGELGTSSTTETDHELINPNDEVIIEADKNIKITQKKGVIEIATKNTVQFDKVKVGDIELDKTKGINAGNKKITGVAPATIGDNSTDAVNGSQLKDLADQLGLTPDATGNAFVTPILTQLENADGTKSVTPTNLVESINQVTAKVNEGINFGAGNSTKGNQKLGSTFEVVASDKVAGETYSEKNLTTTYIKDSNGNGKILIEMNEKPEFKKLSIEGSTVKLTKDGLDNGGNTITNVAAGDDDTDAVNVSQLKDVANQTADNNPFEYTNVDGDKLVKVGDKYFKAGSDGKPTTEEVAKNGVNVSAKGNAKPLKNIKSVMGNNNGDGVITTDKAKTAVGDLLTKTGDLNQAATAGDLQTLAQAGLDFAGDNRAVTIHKELGKKLDVVGGADKTKLTENNIGVNAIDGKLKVQLTKELKGLTSVETIDAAGNKTVQNGKGLTITSENGTAPVSLTDKGLDSGGNKITNVATGTEGTDGVNFKQLIDRTTEIANALGGNTTVNPDGSISAPRFSLTNGMPAEGNPKKVYDTVDDALIALDTAVNAPITFKADEYADTKADGSQQKLGSEFEILAGNATETSTKNLKTKVEDSKIIISMSEKPEFKNVTATEGMTIGKGDDAIEMTPIKTTAINKTGNQGPVNAVDMKGSTFTGLASNVAPVINENIVANPNFSPTQRSNVATLGDVLNTGWNLEVAGASADFVKSYDTVNFVGKEGVTVTEKIGSTDNKTTIEIAIAKGDVTTNTDTGFAETEKLYGFVSGLQVADAINSAFWKTGTGASEDGGVVEPADEVKVKTGSKVEFTSGKNMKVKQVNTANGVKYVYTTKDNVEFNSANIGGTAIDKDGINLNDKKIKGVKKGTENADGVNLGQIKDISNSVADTFGGRKVVNPDGTVSTEFGVPGLAGGPFDNVGDALRELGAELDKGHEFQGDFADTSDVDGFLKRKPGERLVVKGGKTVASELTEGNIGVATFSDNTMWIKLAKDLKLTADGSVNFNGTNLDKDGLEIKDGPKFTKTDIDASGLQIHGVKAGEQGTDAVNVSQLKRVQAEIKEKLMLDDIQVKKAGENYADSKTFGLKGADGKKVEKMVDNVIEIVGADSNILTTVKDNKLTIKLTDTLTDIKKVTGLDDHLSPVTNATKQGVKPTDLATTGKDAAKINDLMNAGWNLEVAGEEKDLVTAYDTVNFEGEGPVTVTHEVKNGKQNIKIGIKKGELETDANGNVIVKPEKEGFVTTQDVADAINGTGFNLSTNGTDAKLIKSGNKVDMKNIDGNLVISHKDIVEAGKVVGQEVNYDLAKDIKLDTVVAKKELMIGEGADSITLASAKTTNVNGINNQPALDLGGKSITGLADNLVPTEGKQEQAAPNTNEVNGKNVATVNDVMNAGFNLTVNDVARDFVKAYDTVNFVDGNITKVTISDTNEIKVDVDITQLPVVYTDKVGNKVAKCKDGFWYKLNDNGSLDLAQIKPEDVKVTIQSPSGDTKTGTKLTNVASGLVDKDGKTVTEPRKAVATNAVNAGDLANVQDDVNDNIANINNLNKIVGGTDANGQPIDVADDLKTYDVEGQTATNNTVVSAIKNMNEGGIKYFHTNDDSGQKIDGVVANTEDSSASGKNSTAIGRQASATAENTIAFGHGSQATAENSIAIGTGNIVNAKKSGTFGDPSYISAKAGKDGKGDDVEGSYSIGNNNVINS